MAFLSCLDISTSALVAQRLRMDVIGQNIANAKTTKTETGEAYRRQLVVFAENKPYKNIDTRSRRREFGEILSMTLEERHEKRYAGVQVLEIVEDETPLTPVYDPSHPDADEEGYYYLPNVDIVEEEIDMMAATRHYEANHEVLSAMIAMANKALTIGKG